MDFSDCEWVSRPLSSDYLFKVAYERNTQAENGEEHSANIERLKSLRASERIFEFRRMASTGFAPYRGENHYPDLIYQKARDDLRQALYDYVISFPEDQRGMIYHNLYFLKFSKVPSDGNTFWADEAYQLASSNRQNIYDSIMLAAPEHRAAEFFLWTTLEFEQKY
jgi:hypothetical protein